MYIILHNIRSAYNVGAIFRTADATGVEKVFLTGYTPTPTDRFGRVQEEIKKTSLGASETVPWQQGDVLKIIDKLRLEGVVAVAIEQTQKSISLRNFIVPKKVVYIFGNEIEGVTADVLEHADTIVEIPMRGQKESLNVSVAAGIILYHEN